MKKARSLVRMPACIRRMLRLLDLVVLKHLELRQELADVVRRLVAVGQLLALVGRGDDARLELLAALVERLDAARHRILDRRRRIDREQHGEGRDGAEHRRDPDDVEAEDVWALKAAQPAWSYVPPLDLEVDHLGHDEGADAHPDHAADAGDHQPLVGEEAAHVVRG